METETIIVQDTDADILDVLTDALSIEGFHVYPVLDCNQDFITLIEHHRPHVVMLDYRLDGEVCKEICLKIKSVYPHLPVIALSCNYNIDKLYGENGFDDYIRKPFDLDLLYSILRKYISQTKN
ncbi:two-component system nitrogen regulation response regulator GlnG [Pedobacter cryoconitis]|uniref:Two-component system nitrogen regulation response regulator GlnG n=1 Tax=Pedobacter cryoconitis TaxID=188932 RepID=A0A7W8YYH0_9SPHI|nr:response regulator [Pedobacter cryoconitis]MBB5624139.1 two-component system nitrogen regulation response regulator GlnG [Pedobacter cryoconitis]